MAVAHSASRWPLATAAAPPLAARDSSVGCAAWPPSGAPTTPTLRPGAAYVRSATAGWGQRWHLATSGGTTVTPALRWRRRVAFAVVAAQLCEPLALAAEAPATPVNHWHCNCSPRLAKRVPLLARWLRSGRLDARGASRYCPMGHTIYNDCLQGVMLQAVACLQAAALSNMSDLGVWMDFYVLASEQAFIKCQAQILAEDLPMHRAEVTTNFFLYKRQPNTFIYQKLPLPQLAKPSMTVGYGDVTAEANRLEGLACRWAWNTFVWHHKAVVRTHDCIGGDFHCRKFGHCYAPVFAPALSLSPHKVDKVLELGVCGGNSLGMWAEFFSNATIVGVDASLESFRLGWPEVRYRLGDLRAKRVHALKGDYTDAASIADVWRHGPFDVVIDDGSHDEDIMWEAFSLWFFIQNGLRPGGLYAIFDVSSAMKETGLARFKSLIDGANLQGEQWRGYTNINTFLRVATNPEDVWVESVEFRRNLILIRKRSALPKEGGSNTNWQ